MSNYVVLPICINKELLFKIDNEVIKEGKDRKNGRAFNRSKFVSKAMAYYLENVLYNKSVNYFKKAEEKLAKVLKK